MILLVACLVSLAGCAETDDSVAPSKNPPNDGAATKREQAAQTKEDPARRNGTAAATGKGTTITLGDSEFATMLFDSKEQAIYIFQRDRDGQTVCYGECAEVWPPVLTEGRRRRAPA